MGRRRRRNSSGSSWQRRRSCFPLRLTGRASGGATRDVAAWPHRLRMCSGCAAACFSVGSLPVRGRYALRGWPAAGLGQLPGSHAHLSAHVPQRCECSTCTPTPGIPQQRIYNAVRLILRRPGGNIAASEGGGAAPRRELSGAATLLSKGHDAALVRTELFDLVLVKR